MENKMKLNNECVGTGCQNEARLTGYANGTSYRLCGDHMKQFAADTADEGTTDCNPYGVTPEEVR
jgi:hypothetical protein